MDSSKTHSDQKRPEFSHQQQKDYQKEINKTAFQSKKQLIKKEPAGLGSNPSFRGTDSA
jgi:hypothetical protein